MPSLYVVRHGAPTTAGVLLGRTDPSLSEAGREQMRAVALDVAAIYTSALARAVESAAIIARGARVIVLEDLVEISFGEWDGLSWTEIEFRWPDLAAAKTADWLGVTPPDGEPWSEFVARVRRAVDEIRRGPLPAAIIGHQAVNACVAQYVAGADPVAFAQQYGEVYEYDV